MWRYLETEKKLCSNEIISLHVALLRLAEAETLSELTSAPFTYMLITPVSVLYVAAR